MLLWTHKRTLMSGQWACIECIHSTAVGQRTISHDQCIQIRRHKWPVLKAGSDKPQSVRSTVTPVPATVQWLCSDYQRRRQLALLRALNFRLVSLAPFFLILFLFVSSTEQCTVDSHFCFLFFLTPWVTHLEGARNVGCEPHFSLIFFSRFFSFSFVCVLSLNDHSS